MYLYNLLFTLYNLQFTIYFVQFTIYYLLCTIYYLLCTIYNLQGEPHISQRVPRPIKHKRSDGFWKIRTPPYTTLSFLSSKPNNVFVPVGVQIWRPKTRETVKTKNAGICGYKINVQPMIPTEFLVKCELKWSPKQTSARHWKEFFKFLSLSWNRNF
jgi:hypothetical protein